MNWLKENMKIITTIVVYLQILVLILTILQLNHQYSSEKKYCNEDTKSIVCFRDFQDYGEYMHGDLKLYLK